MDISSRNLPATPKSVTDKQSDTFSASNKNDNENEMDDEPIGEEYEYTEDYDDSTSVDDQQRFVLAPTPAQLGRAPLQRRLGTLVGGDTNSEFNIYSQIFWKNSLHIDLLNVSFIFCISDQSQIIGNEATFPNTQQIITNTQTSVPSALPTPNSAIMDDLQQQNMQLSPSMLKKPFFKKVKGEDLNKYVFSFECTYFHHEQL